MKMRRSIYTLLLIFAMSALLAGCQSTPIVETVVVTQIVNVESEPQTIVITPTSEPQKESDTIVIGGLGPLSAPGNYEAGTEMLQASEMAVREINEAGGILGKQVELIFGDTEGLPERAAAVTERLITQNEVVGLSGEYHSGQGLVEYEIAHNYGIPIVFAEVWADAVTASQYPEVFRIAPTMEYYSTISANYMVEAGWKSMVFIAEDTDYGHLQTEEWTRQLAGHGVTDVQTIFADAATEDFTPILQRIQQKPPDLLGIALTGVGTGRILRQACDLGLAPTAQTAVYAADAQYPEYWENTGACGNYAVFTYVGLPKSLWNERTRAFMENFQETYQHQPGGHAMEAYDAIYVLLNAIEKAGTTEPAAVINALEVLEYEGVLGKIWFEYGSHNALPEGEKAWLWHQWPTPNVFILQYTEENQSVEDAAVVYPPERSTGPVYTSP
ncbi:MAG: ABC transporter substrate-binding protein [Chloroflexota bacterium]|nr:MAG: ABC transporter substrate-binding protein [Chloroflexota bacterium]